MNKYISRGNLIFKSSKILSINYRNSYIYIKHPYIMKLVYSEKWSNSFLIGAQSSIPITQHFDTLDYIFYLSNKKIKLKNSYKMHRTDTTDHNVLELLLNSANV